MTKSEVITRLGKRVYYRRAGYSSRYVVIMDVPGVWDSHYDDSYTMVFESTGKASRKVAVATPYGDKSYPEWVPAIVYTHNLYATKKASQE